MVCLARLRNRPSGWRLWAIILVAGLLAPVVSRDARAQARGAGGPGRVTATATLTILAGTAQRVPPGSTRGHLATDGMSLHVGDRILTGRGATVVITFLDGTTVTVQPRTDVTVARADIGKTGSRIGLRLNLGAVWARVVRLTDADSGVTLESNTATATLRTGLIGGQQDADGAFICWTQSPGTTVTDRQGRRLSLQPGHRATLRPGQAPVVQAFRVSRSALRISTPPGVLPLLVMPDRVLVAGFVAPGIEVNQVFGSATSQGADGRRSIEVPAGYAGSYLVLLEGQRDVDDALTWAVLYDGAIVYRQALPVQLTKGSRLAVTIKLALDWAAVQDPRTARIVGASARRPVKHTGPLPGRILLAPSEIAAVTGP